MSSKRSAGTKRSLTFLNTLLLASAVSVPAFAQIETVVVTAEKRAQDVQTVPVAISVFSSEKRDTVGIQSIQDMTNFTPGLQYNTSTDRISLRGVGRLTNVLSADASVANYDDGLYETFAVAAGRSSLDLERVEVLRGPQGTLYGRNAIAGALNEITKRPNTDHFTAEFRGSYANYDHATLEGRITGPINDHWAYGIYATWDQQSKGYSKNIIPGHPSEGNVVNEVYIDAQIQAKWSNVEMWTKFQTAWWHNGGGGPGSASGGWTPSDYPTYELGVASTALNPGYGCTASGGVGDAVLGGGTTSAYAPTSPLPLATACANPSVGSPWLISRNNPYKVSLPEYVSINHQWTYHTDSDFDIKYIVGGTYYHYHLTGPANGGNGTGNVNIAPITSYKIKGFLGLAATPTDKTIFGDETFDYQEKNGFVSNEINFISSGDSPLQWVVGAYQFFQHYSQPVFVHQLDQPEWNGPISGTPFNFVCFQYGPTCPRGFDARRFDNRPIVNAESYAGYGQAEWAVTPEWKITGGIRYSWDHKYGKESVRLICYGVPACFAAPEVNAFVPGGIQPVDLTQVASVVSTGVPTLPYGVTGVTTYDPITGFASRKYSSTWGALTGTAKVQWEPDEDTNIYLSYSRGYKSGGFNIGIFTVLSFQPWTDAEHVDSFELGVKHQFGDWLSANLAVFHYSYDNLQIPLAVVQTAGGLTQSQTGFLNIPKSVSQGFEVETLFTPIEHLNVLFNYSYLDAHVTRGFAADPADPNATEPGAQPLYTVAGCAAHTLPVIDPVTGQTISPACALDIYSTGTILQGTAFGTATCPASNTHPCGLNIPQSLKGNDLPNAPRNKVAVNVNYTWNIDGFGSLTPSVSYVWRDVQYGTLFTRSYNQAPSWDQWDARVRMVSESGHYEVTLWGKNIFNKIGYDAGAFGTRLAGTRINPGTAGAQNFIQGINNPAGYGAVRGEDATGHISTYSVTPPATYGVELRYKFGD
jgi:iron complex outermembrane receptor protein